MALINCPECNKEISDKAVNCPSCGFPLNKPCNTQIQQTEQTSYQEIAFPKLPDNLSIGSGITNWGGDTAFRGEFKAEDNIVRDIQPGGVSLLMHTNGIMISSSFFGSQLAIHNAQIINTQFADTAELARQNKSAVGRAVVGGLIMGPLGAIVGGITGVGTKSAKNNSYLVINYWEPTLKHAQTILIRGKDQEIRAFVGRLNTERNKTPPQTEAQRNEIQNLNATDKKILELCEQKGLWDAVGFYVRSNNIDFKGASVTEITARSQPYKKYVEELARKHGVKIKPVGCFIATACYGDYDSPEVLILRQYRDSSLMTNYFGKLFVNFYYLVSPFLATLISKSTVTKRIIRRCLLQPIVNIIQ